VDLWSVVAGFVAYGVSLLAAVLLVFVTYRLNMLLTSRIDEERLLLQGNRSVAIGLGSILLSQAILLRHAVFPTMTMVRDLFLRPVSFAAAVRVLGHGVAFFLIVGSLAFGSVALATWLFKKMTGRLPEREQILKDNVAVAILFAFVILGVTLIVNEGLEDLSRSIIPQSETGILRLP
jgi:uncharacterized membrane protein YjfL (UPF0719 family)